MSDLATKAIQIGLTLIDSGVARGKAPDVIIQAVRGVLAGFVGVTTGALTPEDFLKTLNEYTKEFDELKASLYSTLGGK